MDAGLIVAVAIILICLGVLLVFFSFMKLWLKAWLSGVPVSFVLLVAMRVRGTNARKVVGARIKAAKAGLDIDLANLEGHALAGGDVDRVVQALITANAQNAALTWQQAAQLDLAGHNVLESVKLSTNPSDGV